MKKCPFCAEDIQDAAVVCKHCGRDLVPKPRKTKKARGTDGNVGTPLPTPEPSDLPAPMAETGLRGWLGIAGALAILFGVAVWWSRTDSSSKGWQTRAYERARVEQAQEERARSGARVMATVVCHEAVRQRLKAPASAEFSSAQARGLGGARYELRSYVDAENSFGAKLRQNFTCRVEGGGNETSGYRILEVSGLE